MDGSFPRPYSPFPKINYFGASSNSIYISGTVTLRRRFTKELFVPRRMFTPSRLTKVRIRGGDCGGVLECARRAEFARRARAERLRYWALVCGEFHLGAEVLEAFAVAELAVGGDDAGLHGAAVHAEGGECIAESRRRRPAGPRCRRNSRGSGAGRMVRPDGVSFRTARVVPVWVFGAERVGWAGVLYFGYKFVAAVCDRRTEGRPVPGRNV